MQRRLAYLNAFLEALHNLIAHSIIHYFFQKETPESIVVPNEYTAIELCFYKNVTLNHESWPSSLDVMQTAKCHCRFCRPQCGQTVGNIWAPCCKLTHLRWYFEIPKLNKNSSFSNVKINAILHLQI